MTFGWPPGTGLAESRTPVAGSACSGAHFETALRMTFETGCSSSAFPSFETDPATVPTWGVGEPCSRGPAQHHESPIVTHDFGDFRRGAQWPGNAGVAGYDALPPSSTPHQRQREPGICRPVGQLASPEPVRHHALRHQGRGTRRDARRVGAGTFRIGREDVTPDLSQNG